MDTATMTASERAVELQKKITALDGRRRDTESALARETTAQRDLTAKRAVLVEELPGADEATVAWAHNEIDGIDSRLRGSSRVAEGLSNSLPKLVNEIAALTAELEQVASEVRAQERAAQLKAFTEKLRCAAKEAEQDLNRVRESLSALTRLGADGVAAFEFDAQRICEQAFADFFASQTNLDERGWRPASPSYTTIEFLIRPLTRM